QTSSPSHAPSLSLSDAGSRSEGCDETPPPSLATGSSQLLDHTRADGSPRRRRETLVAGTRQAHQALTCDPRAIVPGADRRRATRPGLAASDAPMLILRSTLGRAEHERRRGVVRVRRQIACI